MTTSGKYCPSCGKQNHDVLQYCWNCGEWLGRGSVPELGTEESAKQVGVDLNLPEAKPVQTVEGSDKVDLALVTFYGVGGKELHELLTKHDISYQVAEMPGLCKEDKALNEYQAQQEERKKEVGGRTSGGYYHDDPYTTGYCAYYCCFPSRRYRSYHSRRSDSACGGSSDCDCNDSGSDSDDAAGLVILVFLVVLVALLILFAPQIAIVGAIFVEFAISLVLLVFNVITLGLFRKQLSRTRVRIRSASKEKLDDFMRDLISVGGLPRMPGYWTSGFMLVRYGAIFFVLGLVTVTVAYFIPHDTKAIYAIPATVVGLSVLAFGTGYWAIRRKLAEVKTKY